MANLYLDFKVPSRILGVNNLYLFKINLKKALLLPELYRVTVSVVDISTELGSNSNFKLVLSMSISTGTLLAVTVISN